MTSDELQDFLGQTQTHDTPSGMHEQWMTHFKASLDEVVVINHFPPHAFKSFFVLKTKQDPHCQLSTPSSG